MGARRVSPGFWIAAIVGVALLLAPAARAAVEPYGTNDAGGFRNVLPPGEAGTDNAVAARRSFSSTAPIRTHWADQQPLYDDLLYASPQLTNAQIADYFKDATFGVRPGDVESTTTPRPGVTIVRDKQYGVPHIYGDTRADVMFGAGYAGAQDRLFLMDILRHTGRAELSSFVGGSPSNREMDRAQWALAPYTEQDLQKQIDRRRRSLRRRGRAGSSTTCRTSSPASTPTSPRRCVDPTMMPARVRRARQARRSPGRPPT